MVPSWRVVPARARQVAMPGAPSCGIAVCRACPAWIAPGRTRRADRHQGAPGQPPSSANWTSSSPHIRAGQAANDERPRAEPGLPRWPAAPGSSMLPRHRPASRWGHVRHHRRGPPSRRARRAPRRSRSRTQPAGRRVLAREPAGVPRSGGLGTSSDRHSAPATAPVAPTVESGDTAGAATSSPRRSPSTSECPGTGDPGTPRAHASLVHRTAQTGEASRRIVSAKQGHPTAEAV